MATGKPQAVRREALELRCWYCDKPMEIEISGLGVKFVRCEHCGRPNKIVRRWVAERPDDDAE